MPTSCSGSRRRVNSTVIRLTSMTKILLIIMALFAFPHAGFAQQSNRSSLGWDLTYTSLLDANNIGRDEWIGKWLGPNYRSPIQQLISDWNDEPIESSILIEHGAPHAGEHITLWFVRTKNHAYDWGLVEGCFDSRRPVNSDDRLLLSGNKMKYVSAVLFALAVVISSPRSIPGQQPQCDKDCVQEVRGMLKASYDGFSLSWLDKANSRLGDKIGVAILKIYKGKALYKPDNIRTFLPVIQLAFKYPDMIENPTAKNPTVTLPLLRGLRKRIKDHFLNLEITGALNVVQFNGQSSKSNGK